MRRTHRAFLDAIPAPPESDILAWAEQNIKLIGSARSESFERNTAPWLIEPLLCWADDTTRKETLVGPVQSGKSVAGEVSAQYSCSFRTGFIQYNWPDDRKSDLRWVSRFEKILKSCKTIKFPEDRSRVRKGEIDAPSFFFKMQGVWAPGHLDSDSIKNQINEEIHAWEPGHLQKAYNRTTAFSWISKILNVSNAGMKGDQLEQAFKSGTQQHWQVLCPGCKQFHAMRTRWEDDKPNLGGLRYDSKCKRDDGSYSYERLKSTIRFQMPCGYVVQEDVTQRRALSLSGRYSDPQNTGADLAERSYTLEGVSVDWIPWIELIKQKHEALAALRYGDPAPWMKYLQERECQFYDATNRPTLNRLVVNTKARKNREGIPDRVMRGMTVDKQRGVAARGETPHYWVAIRDWRKDASSMLVYEGKVQLIEDVEKIREDHGVIVGPWPERSFVLIDSGWDASEVYRICSRYGYTAIKGEDRAFYMHDVEDEYGAITKVRRIYSPVQLLDPYEGDNQGRAGETHIPLILYSKQAIMDRLGWLRSRGRTVDEEWTDDLERAGAKKFFDVPGDVSEDYKKHADVWELQKHVIGRTQENVMLWTKIIEHARDDLHICECYQALLAEMSGLIGAQHEKERK